MYAFFFSICNCLADYNISDPFRKALALLEYMFDLFFGLFCIYLNEIGLLLISLNSLYIFREASTSDTRG